MNDRSHKHIRTEVAASDRIRVQELVHTHYRHVFGVCYSMLGNVHDAEDATQETLLKGLLKEETLDQPDQFRSWIVRVARNLCIDWLRKRKRPGRPIPRGRDVHTGSRQDLEAQADLDQALGRLPVELRVPLLMYYFDGQSAKAIAENLNISHSGACQKLRLARQQLHDLLSERSQP